MTAALPLIGHAEAQSAFEFAAASGRMHHAWMIEGPSGIGKARFALRCAAWLLGARGPADAPFDAPQDDPVMSRCLSGGHPDLRVLTRELNDKGKLKQDISIEQIRAFNEFFTYRPALGGWRVGIVDSLDELNRNSANAVLKTLEEPPNAAMMFLINHGSRPVLPTIRSRCRTLRLRPLEREDMEAVLQLEGFGGNASEIHHGRPCCRTIIRNLPDRDQRGSHAYEIHASTQRRYRDPRHSGSGNRQRCVRRLQGRSIVQAGRYRD